MINWNYPLPESYVYMTAAPEAYLAMWNFFQDLRFAFRQFRKAPGFALTAIFSLTLGIGATTAIFSVVYGVLIDPYPYKDNNRMVHIELRDKNGRGPLLKTNGAGYPRFVRPPPLTMSSFSRRVPRI